MQAPSSPGIVIHDHGWLFVDKKLREDEECDNAWRLADREY